MGELKDYILEHFSRGKDCGYITKELVRCKDCVFACTDENLLYCDKIYKVAEGDLYGVSLPVTPDDYCSRGERKEY